MITLNLKLEGPDLFISIDKDDPEDLKNIIFMHSLH
jgi:hypothetical protein